MFDDIRTISPCTLAQMLSPSCYWDGVGSDGGYVGSSTGAVLGICERARRYDQILKGTYRAVKGRHETALSRPGAQESYRGPAVFPPTTHSGLKRILETPFMVLLDTIAPHPADSWGLFKTKEGDSAYREIVQRLGFSRSWKGVNAVCLNGQEKANFSGVHTVAMGVFLHSVKRCTTKTCVGGDEHCHDAFNGPTDSWAVGG